jgi:alkaline phosphatase D
MIGYVDMRVAHIWNQFEKVDGTAMWSVYAQVNDSLVLQKEVEIHREHFNTATTELALLEPGTPYYAKLVSSGEVLDSVGFTTQPLWDFRTDPPAFKVLTGSCTFINEEAYDRPGNGYGGEYEIFNTMSSSNADLMLWLGDNIYLREVDFGSYEGFGYRYSHMRSTPELQALLQSQPNVAIWDDHDFGPNDCDGNYVHKDWAQQAFEAFWANPGYGLANSKGGITTQFRFVDVEFFLLDNRYDRINHHNITQQPQILGEEQINWLLGALKNSRAPFKMVAVGGQFLSDAAIYENHAQFPLERSEILRRLDEEDIRGVIFLTGDRHNGELTRLELPGGNWVHDLTVSPLTSSSYDHTDEPNSLRVEGTMIGQRHFGELNFSGPRKDRSLNIIMRTTEGDTLWSHNIRARDL